MPTRTCSATVLAALTLLAAALAGCRGTAGTPPAADTPPAASAATGTAVAPATATAAGSSTSPPPPGGAPEVELPVSAVRTIATGLRIPWGIAFLPDGTALVTERGNDLQSGRDRRDPPDRPPTDPGERGVARVLSVTPAGRTAEVLRLPHTRTRGDGRVSYGRGEGGLLGIAVSPAYATDRWIYLYYTTDTDNRIARFRLGGQPQPIFTGIPAGPFHNGGRLAFGPDGMLYATTGETGVMELAQDRGSLAGKILRLTPDGRPAPGNPFPGSAVWSLGHRNVQGLGWDAAGRMYASELGLGTYDELNRIEPGRNYGWPVHEGPDGGDSRYTDPVATWSPTSIASPSGIAVVGDRAYVACLAGKRLYRVGLDGLDGRNMQALLVGDYGRLRAVAAAPDGSLWLLTTNRDGNGQPVAADDRILRLTP